MTWVDKYILNATNGALIINDLKRACWLEFPRGCALLDQFQLDLREHLGNPQPPDEYPQKAMTALGKQARAIRAWLMFEGVQFSTPEPHVVYISSQGKTVGPFKTYPTAAMHVHHIRPDLFDHVS